MPPTPQQLEATYTAGGGKPLTTDQILGKNSGGASSLLVTSSGSRAETAANTTALNTAKTGLAAGNTAITGTGTPDPNTGKTTGTTGAPATPTTTATPDPNAGNNVKTNADGSSFTKNADGSYTFTPSGGTPASGASAGTTGTDGGNSNAGTDGNNSSATDPSNALDPAIKQQYNDTIQNLTGSVNDAKSNLDAARATMTNDPALQTIIDGITQQYDKQIKLMTDKNSLVLGQVRTSIGAFGGLGQMSSNFLNEQQGRADARVNDLVAKEKDLIAKATVAQQTKDFKAFNEAVTAYSKANADKIKAINDLSSATNKAVTQAQNEVKIQQAAIKATTDRDIKVSTNLGKTMADTITASGVTDPAQIDAYIKGMAQQYGITNPDILKSAYVKASQDQTKLDQGTAKNAISIANTKSQIAARNKPKVTKAPADKGSGVDGGYKYSSSDVGSYTTFLNQGGSGKGGTVYGGRGSDGFVNTGTYIYAYNDWVAKQNGTPQGFLKKFPLSNINPADYASLPKALQPKPKATAAAAVIPS